METERGQKIKKGTEVAICEPGVIARRTGISERKVASTAQDTELQILLKSTATHLTDSEVKELRKLIYYNPNVFSRSPAEYGRTSVTTNRINTGDSSPIKQAPRRLLWHRRDKVVQMIREMEENDIIEPSMSQWASPVVLVKKKDGSTRFCVDYR